MNAAMIIDFLASLTETSPVGFLNWLDIIVAALAAALYLLLSRSTKMKPSSGRAKGAKEQQKAAPASALPLDSVAPGNAPVQQANKALRQGKLNEAITLVKQLRETKEGSVPTALAHRLLVTLSKSPALPTLMSELKPLEGKISALHLEAAISDATKSKDAGACRQLQLLARQLSIPKSNRVFEALAGAYAFDAASLRTLVQEAESPLAKPFAKIALESCAIMKDSNLAMEIFEKVATEDTAFLRQVVEKAAVPGPMLRLPGATVKRPSSGSGTAPATTSAGSSSERSSSVGSHTSNSRNSGSEEGSADSPRARESPSSSQRYLAGISFNTMPPKEIAMRANDIRSCGKNGDLRGAVKVFERLGRQSEHTLLLNSILDACVECKDLEKASDYFNQVRRLGLADVVSYNTMMKGLFAQGREAEAGELLAELSKKGLVATHASFHGLLNARINSGDFPGAWKLVEQMQAAGIRPNPVTCSILLKGRLHSLADVSRTLALIDEMDQPMDEVLFLSVIEACIRTGRLDLLSKHMEKYFQQGGAAGLTAPTYGSMIKAYGHARDMNRVRQLWSQMINHQVQPTAVTLGCMVEALVANGCAHEAWQLAQDMQRKECTKTLVNTVIYSSIMKGLANGKETDRVMELYQEMRSNNITPNTITFNTILNAFAKGGNMDRVPVLLEDMKAACPPVEPDIVTYSTIIKGFCNAGCLDRALKVLKDMQASGKYEPDEVMYNSLLGGCAKEHRPDRALQLLADMKRSGVAPSNYTLSMLVKLMGRCRRINQAFQILEEISKEYGLKINIQVYTCLIQGCFNNGVAAKAVALHDKIIQEGLVPDAMTYTVLVHGCLQAGLLDKAVEMTRCAYGLGMKQSKYSPAPGLNAGCLDEVLSALGGEGSAQAAALKTELASVKTKVAAPGRQPMNGGGRFAQRRGRKEPY